MTAIAKDYSGLRGLIRYLRDRRTMRRECARGHAFGPWLHSPYDGFYETRTCERCNWQETR